MLILRHCRLSSEDLITTERVMLRFISGRMEVQSLGFNVWDYSIPEIYGIILGMFIKLGLLECLDITAGELLDFIIDVDRGYMATYYHSFYHAADVTAVLYHFLDSLHASQYLAKADMTVLLLAGLCHDIGHPGLNNLFQVNAETELYKQFGEASVLEKYSCSLAMDLCSKHNIFRNVHKSAEAALPEGHQPTDAGMREAMVKAIMATDMSVHYDMLNNLNMLIEVTTSPVSSPSSSDAETDPEAEDDNEEENAVSPIEKHQQINGSSIVSAMAKKTCIHQHDNDENRDESTEAIPQPDSIPNQQRRVTISSRRRSPSNSSVASTESDCSDVSTRSNSSTQTPHSPECRPSSYLSPELRQVLCQCLLHAADISNAVKPWELCKRWSDLVVQEFFRQGDIEKAQNLPVSPNMDRDMHNQPQISLGFGDFVVQPYFESLAELLPAASELLDTLTANRAQWVVLQKAAAQQTESSHHLQVGPIETPSLSKNAASAPATPTLTTGRRVSVAAGVLTLDESRPTRPPHRRLRHSTNTDPQHHLLRKMKRSLSGRSLSSIHNIHTAPIPRLYLSSSKEPAATAMKKEATQVNKDTPVVAGHLGSSITPSSLPPSLQPSNTSGIDADHHRPTEDPMPIHAGHRLRRRGSLQLEHQNPHHTSIRHEYGDGYVVFSDHDRDISGHLPASTTSSSSPIDAVAVANRQSTPAVMSRNPYTWFSPPGSIGTFSLRSERSGCGPLDANPCMDPLSADPHDTSMGDDHNSKDKSQSSAPVSSEGVPLRKTVDFVPSVSSTSTVSVGEDKQPFRDGFISIATASPVAHDQEVSLVSVDGDGEAKATGAIADQCQTQLRSKDEHYESKVQNSSSGPPVTL
ncbi:hypothetical protein BGW42_006084 [Actinomortierella wolfii]|nr:hypothetical protein BGW42_006084 [Actinomortierella wolfii]